MIFRLLDFDESMKIYFIQKYHMCEKDYVMYGLKINPLMQLSLCF